MDGCFKSVLSPQRLRTRGHRVFKTSHTRWLWLALIVACSSESSNSSAISAKDPAQGSERGSCYEDGACDDGLTCLSEVCVEAGESGGKGGGGQGGAGSGSAGAPSGASGAPLAGASQGGAETGGLGGMGAPSGAAGAVAGNSPAGSPPGGTGGGGAGTSQAGGGQGGESSCGDLCKSEVWLSRCGATEGGCDCGSCALGSCEPWPEGGISQSVCSCAAIPAQDTHCLQLGHAPEKPHYVQCKDALSSPLNEKCEKISDGVFSAWCCP